MTFFTESIIEFMWFMPLAFISIIVVFVGGVKLLKLEPKFCRNCETKEGDTTLKKQD